jgi:preprotein translocase subunit SecE
VSDLTPGAGKRSDESRLGGGGLRVYKAGQGYYTRVGTAVGAGVLVIWGMVFMYSEFQQYMNPKSPYFLPVAWSMCLAFLAVMGGLVYWAVGLSRNVSDFFIATEGEMKKVSWSTWPEVIRSTKVVVVTVVVMAVFLFVVDIGFMMLFRALKVLEAAPTLQQLFGMKS